MGLAGHHLDGIGRKSRRDEGVAHDAGEGLIARRGGGGPAKKRSVAALQAQARGIDGDIRTGLIDHADDAERHAQLTHLQAIGKGVAANDLAHRVGQAGDIPEGLGDVGDARRREGEPVDERCRSSGLHRPGNIGLVRRDDLGGSRIEGIGYREERGILLVPGQQAQGRSSLPGSTCGLEDSFLLIAHGGSLEREDAPRGNETRLAMRCPAAAVEGVLVDDLDSDHLPVRQPRAHPVLCPQSCGEFDRTRGVRGLVPIANLGPVRCVPTSEEEGVLIAQSFERGPDLVGRDCRALHGQRDVPHAGGRIEDDAQH